MKYILIAFLLMAVTTNVALAHGGGCRKADLPKCCHMEKKTGRVHCH